MHTTKETSGAGHVRQLLRALPLKIAKDGERLLRLAEVESRCGIKKSRIYAGMAEGTFPKCVRLPGGRAVAWPASRIDAWITAVIEASAEPQQAVPEARL
jgi:prophage regulatory protein